MGNTPSTPQTPYTTQPPMTSSAIISNQTPNVVQSTSTTTSETLNWIHSSPQTPIPANAFIGGNEADGTVIYVGRSFHNGDMLVANFMPSKQTAYVTWHGEQVKKDHFELLCGDNYSWRQCNDLVVPQNAVLCGKTKLGDVIYIGRGNFEGGLIVGKISAMHRALFIPYNGIEKRLDNYEILVQENATASGWSVPAPIEEKISQELEEELPPPPPYGSTFSLPQAPTAPLAFGTQPLQQTNTPIQLSYAPMQQNTPVQQYPSMVPQKPPAASVYPNLPPHYQYHNPTAPVSGMQPLQQTNAPIQQPYAPMQQNAQPVFYAQPGVTSSIFNINTYKPAKIGYLSTNPQFVPAQVSTNTVFPVPTKNPDIWSSGINLRRAFPAGRDIDGTELHICRVAHEGDVIPGKIVGQTAYISYGGSEISKFHYETLIGDRFTWVPSFNGNVPPGAVEGGRTSQGETLYIGRAQHKSSLTPGKIHPSHKCLYIPFGGKEEHFQQYEVLVHV